MGKQTRFYVTQKDLDSLIAKTHVLGGTVIDINGNVLNDTELSNLADPEYRQANFARDTFYIKLEGSKIEMNSLLSVNHVYSEVVELCLCEQRREETNQFSYGRIWYQHQHYNLNGDIVIKPDAIQDFFNKLRRYITRNYKISKDKFAYIGPDCYNQYKKGDFIPRQGIYLAEFD